MPLSGSLMNNCRHHYHGYHNHNSQHDHLCHNYVHRYSHHDLIIVIIDHRHCLHNKHYHNPGHHYHHHDDHNRPHGHEESSGMMCDGRVFLWVWVEDCWAPPGSWTSRNVDNFTSPSWKGFSKFDISVRIEKIKTWCSIVSRFLDRIHEYREAQSKQKYRVHESSHNLDKYTKKVVSEWTFFIIIWKLFSVVLKIPRDVIH